MKKSLALATVIFLTAVPPAAIGEGSDPAPSGNTSVRHDVKNEASQIKHGIKKTARQIKDGIKHGVKNGFHEVKHGVKQAFSRQPSRSDD